MPERKEGKEDYLTRWDELEEQSRVAQETDPTIGLNLEGQRRSTNVVEYRPGIWDQIMSYFRGPVKSVETPSFWSYGPRDLPNGLSDDQIFFLRKNLGFLSDEQLESESPEVRNLYRLRTNPEAFEGYLYDLDSRGIAVQSQLNDTGTVDFALRLQVQDSFGSNISTEQLRETENFLRQREPEIYNRSETSLFAPITPPGAGGPGG